MGVIHAAESFTSFQGTGHLLGTRMHFVRFAGCSVAQCPIREQCDEPDALTRRGSFRRTAEDLVSEAVEAVGERGWLHITGGEPTDQPEGLQELVRLARERGLYVHVQSSGIRRVPVQWDWLTVSPKAVEPLQTFGQELVVIDDGTVTVERLWHLAESTKFWCYYLCPVWGRDMAETATLAHDAGGPWALTLQAHKVGGFR